MWVLTVFMVLCFEAKEKIIGLFPHYRYYLR